MHTPPASQACAARAQSGVTRVHCCCRVRLTCLCARVPGLRRARQAARDLCVHVCVCVCVCVHRCCRVRRYTYRYLVGADGVGASGRQGFETARAVTALPAHGLMRLHDLCATTGMQSAWAKMVGRHTWDIEWPDAMCLVLNKLNHWAPNHVLATRFGVRGGKQDVGKIFKAMLLLLYHVLRNTVRVLLPHAGGAGARAAGHRGVCVCVCVCVAR